MGISYSYKSAPECPIISILSLQIGTWMPYYFYHKSPYWHLNAVFYWKLDQLLLSYITVEKLKNQLWGVFSYFRTRVSTPKEKPFLPFVIFSLYFCWDLSLLIFYYIVIFSLFGYCHFRRHSEMWVQFIFVRLVLQYIGLLHYIHFLIYQKSP